MKKQKVKKLRGGFYKKHKQEYLSKIVDYDSPTGKAFIGVAKEPLMKNEDGFGYQGVLIQDDNRQFIQCAACGEWHQKITSAHLTKCSGLTTEEYKEKYKLNKSTGLVADELSLKLTKQAFKNKSNIRIMKYSGAIKTKKEHKRTRSRETENAYGTCPEQIKARLYDFIWCNRELPTRMNRGRSLYKILWRRFGSLGEGLRHYGLPNFKRAGTNYVYTFPDWTIYKYNINQIDGREQLFAMLQVKCPMFKEFITKNAK